MVMPKCTTTCAASRLASTDTPIMNEECINHVEMHAGTALCTLAKESKKKGVTLGGHGYGKLPQARISRVTDSPSGEIQGMRR